MDVGTWKVQPFAYVGSGLVAWQILSGVCLFGAAAFVLKVGESASGIGIPASRLGISFLAIVPCSAIGLTLWILGFFRSAVVLLLMAGTFFAVSGVGIWLGQGWARQTALGLHSLNVMIALLAVLWINRLDIVQSSIQSGACLFGGVSILVNLAAVWFVLGR
jgi:hypothetical protein